MHKFLIFSILLIFGLSGINLSADASFNSVYKDYLYMLTLSGERNPKSLNYHTSSRDIFGIDSRNTLWGDHSYYNILHSSNNSQLAVIPFELILTYNSEKAYGMNDGAFWQGKGVNARSMGGIYFENNWLQAVFLPEVWLSQNRDFQIIPASSSFGDYWQTNFDNLQRYGDNAYYQFDWGQSEIRVEWKDILTLGFGNENIIIGPGRENNIILGENSSGFPHFDFGTDGIIPFLNWGDIDVRIIWGWLKESEFFDNDDSNNYAWMSGMYTAWSPSFYKNITLCLNYQYYSPMSVWSPLNLIKFLPIKFEKNSGVDPTDAMVSASFEWRFPEIGLNIYTEWGRNDNLATILGTFVEPEHTQAITVGFSQVLLNKRNTVLVFSAELSNLEQERTYLLRPGGPWYRHGWAGWTQGFTNNGQLMGAAIGPGSNSQKLQLAWYHTAGVVNFFVQRIAHDKDYYYHLAYDLGDLSAGEYTEAVIGAESAYNMGKVQLYGNITYSYSLNYNFISENNLSNLHLETGVRYSY